MGMFALAMSTLLTAPATEPAPAIIVEDFDLQGFIDSAIKSGQKRVVVPRGRYRITPKNREHLVLRGLNGIEIVADGVEMVCSETTRALTIEDCRDLTVRGLAIDYDPLPFTQGRITSLSPDKRVHEIELFPGYPPAETAQAFKYEIFRPDTRTLRCPDYGYRVEKVDSRHIRVVKDRGRPDDPEQVGDLCVIGSETAPGGSIPHAVECSRDVNLKLANIDLFGSNCFGFFEVNCDGTIYDHCRVDRRPPASDPVQRGDARLRSLNADAFHSKHALKGPTLIGCFAQFMGDDAVNICGNYHMIVDQEGDRLRVLAKDEMDLEVGDLVELLSYEGTRLPDAKVVRIEPDGSINEGERRFLIKQRMDEGLRTRWTPKAYRVTLDRRVVVSRGSLIASSRRMGNGFLVQGCDFGFNRSRGILIKASQGRVIDNTISGTWGEAIKLSPEYWWLESGSSNDVEIAGNQIKDCRTTGIAVHASGGLGQLAPAGAHNRIKIDHNRIVDCPMPNLYVTSTNDLQIENNTCLRTFRLAISPIEGHPDDLRAIMTLQCTNSTIRANRIEP